MKKQIEKQAIEEMAKIICRGKDCRVCVHSFELRECGAKEYAKRLYNAGYRKQINAVWVVRICEFSDGTKMVEEYNCSNCLHEEGDNDKHFCPNCGAHMKGGAE